MLRWDPDEGKGVWNAGIENATGELIMIMSGHATYATNYISRCVEASVEYCAECVVGSWNVVPRDESVTAKAIVAAMSDGFGVGNATYRTSRSIEPVWVDTGAYGCYQRGVFKRIGVFNERLTRGQDMEFNVRLRRAGGRILLVPDAVVNYYARTDLKGFCIHNFRNGVWAILPFLYSEVRPVSWRHLIPLMFVTGLFGSALIAIISPVGSWLFAAVGGSYAMANLGASARSGFRERSAAQALLMPAMFACLHVPYGVGSLCGLGILTRTREFWRRLAGIRGPQ